MSTFAILASGPSMSAALAERIRASGVRRIVVNSTYLLAPDADVLVANDASWWNAHPEALKFGGAKYSTARVGPDVRQIQRKDDIACDTNSALLGLHVAVVRGASLVLIFGVDLHGEHWHGPHQKTANPTPQRLKAFAKQFHAYALRRIPNGVKVINCSPESELDVFPKVKSWDEAFALLGEPSRAAAAA